MITKQTDSVKLKDVTLIEGHTHNGKKYAKGSSIQVDGADEAWLIAQGIVAAPSTATTEVPKK